MRWFLCLLVVVSAAAKSVAEDVIRKPSRFAIIFNAGYAGDRLPKGDAGFEKLITGIKSAHFNTILCKYTPARAKICRKHDIQIFVDLLVPDHHIYKNVEAAKLLCRSLRKSDVIYGYHIWSDNIGGTYPGRSRDAKNVRLWDPNHPVYVGTYRMSRVNRVTGNDLLGYYDFQWRRGGHWGNLSKAWRVAASKKISFLRYCDSSPGQIGKGNPNRCGYTIATSIPFGLKGYLYHYRGGVVDAKSGKLDALGKDLQKVNANFAAIGDHLLDLGNPTGVFSTKVTKTAKDRPTGKEAAVPAGLTAIPDDAGFEIKSGEVLAGVFSDSKKRRVFAFASHNAYQPQKVAVSFSKTPRTVELFDRTAKKWKPLTLSGSSASFDVAVYATELIRVSR